MEKNNTPYLKKLECRFSFFSNNVIISLLIIGIIGIGIRILFLHIDIPINSDNFLYFRYAIDQITGSAERDIVYNNGWPLFLSVFFSSIPSSNFLDFMALQRLLTIGISVLTIIPIYYLGKQFFSKSYAIIGSAIFVFEPSIAQNSLFGITEPLYIIILTISFVLIFNKKNYLKYISFITLSCAILVRSEALFLIPIFLGIFYLQSGINKKSILNLFIIFGIMILILLPASMLRSEQIGNNGMTDRITNGIDHLNYASDGNQNQLISIAQEGIFNMFKFLAWSQIPYLIFFVPFGILLIIKTGDKFEKSLILIGISLLIPTIYGYAFASDTRYIFPIYPIFCIMSIYSIKYVLQKTTKPKLVTILIFSIIIFSSIFYLNWKDIDENHELEAYNLALEISDKATMVNAFYPESAYLNVIGLTKIEKFPAPSYEYMEKRTEYFWYDETSSITELIKDGKEQGLTHLVIDDNKNRPQFIKNILINEEKFPFLIKEFDSFEQGYQYRLNIYKIDYNKIDLMN